MSHKKGAEQIKKSVSVTKEDISAFHEMENKGVDIVSQMIPNDRLMPFMELVKDK